MLILSLGKSQKKDFMLHLTLRLPGPREGWMNTSMTNEDFVSFGSTKPHVTPIVVPMIRAWRQMKFIKKGLQGDELDVSLIGEREMEL